jgi:hypothetical protein
MLVPPLPGLPARPLTPTDFEILEDAENGQPPTQSVGPLKSVREMLESRQTQALLENAFANRKRPKHPRQPVAQDHNEYLLKTPLGRDFAVQISDGVEFKVHTTMILGHSKTLQEYIFPGEVSFTHSYRGLELSFAVANKILQVPNPSPPTFVDLPPSFLPIVVDRLVNFLYRYNYSSPSEFAPSIPKHAAVHGELPDDVISGRTALLPLLSCHPS